MTTAKSADRTRATVDERAVDQRLVADLPETEPESARPAREHVLVEPVEVVLVHEQPVQRAELRQQARRDVGALQIQEPRDDRARERELDRRTEEAVLHEGRGPVEFLADDLERVLTF